MTRRFASAVSLFSFALAPLGLHASPEAPAVYPNPHAMKVTGGMLTLDAGAKISGADVADADAVKLLRARLALAAGQAASGAAKKISEIIIGERGEPAVKGFDAGIPAVSGAYRIVAAPGRLVIVGHDARGTFYAMQTLRQLLDDDANPADLPAVEITDFPTIPFRGIVEGFYGIPGDCWDHEGRLSLLTFSGRNKMNTYIYGPKDDPFHRSQWRKPYPAKESERIHELVTASRAAKVDFVWAIHPGGDIKWTESDYLAAKAKFEDMYRLGVRSFAVFFDDIGGDGTNPVKQAEMLNRLEREFVKAKGDVTPLILCPTEYNKGWSNPKKGGYLDILGEQLDPDIRVMWTGNTVVADLDKASMDYINARLRRKAYIWWNAPCNDFSRRNLSMGPTYGDTGALPAPVRDTAKALGQKIFGNSSDAAELMSGFTSNPMGRSEASKVGLYGVAGYCWNPKDYDAVAAWNRAMTEIMPKAADAFRTFCAHNEDNGPNGHGYRRPESVEIAPVAKTFLESFRNGKPDTAALATLRAEFVRVAAAPAAIRAGADNPALIAEIGGWLDAFARLGVAGESAMDVAVAGDKSAAWSAYARASGAMSAMEEISRENNKNPYQSGVKTGSLVLEPLVTEVLKTSGAKIRSAVSGRPVASIRPITNSGSTGSLDKMTDGDPKTYYYSEQIQKVGDWFGVDLGAGIPVSTVSILMGRKDGDHDIVHRGQLEYSVDGKTWTALGAPTTGESVSWTGRPVAARQVRYRVLTAGKLDGTKNEVWCAIREFRVNPAALPAKIFTSVKNLAAVPVRADGAVVSLTPQLEVFRLDPGRHVGIELPDIAGVTKIEADLSAADPASWAKLEVSSDGKKWEPVAAIAAGTALTGEFRAEKSPGIPHARFVRVRNAGKGPQDVKLSGFKVTLAPGAGAIGSPFTDGDLATAAPIGARLAVEIPGDARGVALLFATGAGKGVKVGVAASKDGAPEPLGVAAGDLAEFALPAGRKWLVITPVSPDAKLHEIVWRVK